MVNRSNAVPAREPVPDEFSAALSRLVRMKRAAEEEIRNTKISRPSTLQSLIPVVGPAWEAAADLQDGRYGSAAFNGALAAADAVPWGLAARAVNIMSKVRSAQKGIATAEEIARAYRRLELKKPLQHLHHSVPLKWLGLDRHTPHLINHPIFLKILDPVKHQRIHTQWKGAPKFDPVRQIWYGTNAFQKSAGVSVLGKGAGPWDTTNADPQVQGFDSRSK